MGLANESSEYVWLSTYEGKIAQRAAEDIPGAKHRVKKNNEAVWELYYDTLEGELEDVEIQDPPEEFKRYGKSLVVTVADGGTKYKLRIHIKSRMANGFLYRLPNLDFTRPIKLKTYWIEDQSDGKYRGSLTVHQDGKKIDPYYTKEDPNGLPPLEKVTVDGEERWDSTKQLAFLSRMIEQQRERLRQENPLSDSADAETTEDYIPQVDEVEAPPEEDDLPF